MEGGRPGGGHTAGSGGYAGGGTALAAAQQQWHRERAALVQELQAARRSAREQPPGAAAEGQHLRQRVRELQEAMAFKDEELAQARRHGERVQGRLQSTLQALEAARRRDMGSISGGKEGPEVLLDPRPPPDRVRPFAAATDFQPRPLVPLGSLAFFLKRPPEGPLGPAVCGLARGELDAPEAAAHIFGLLLGRAEALAAAERDFGEKVEGLEVLQHALPVLARLLESDRRVRESPLAAKVFLGGFHSGADKKARVRFRGKAEAPAWTCLPRTTTTTTTTTTTATPPPVHHLGALARLLGLLDVRALLLRCVRTVLAGNISAADSDFSADDFARHLSPGLADALRRRFEDPGAAREAALVLSSAVQHPGLLGALLGFEEGAPIWAELAFSCLLDEAGEFATASLRVLDQALRTCLCGHDSLLGPLLARTSLARRLVAAADRNERSSTRDLSRLREILRLLRRLVEASEGAAEDVLGSAGGRRQALWTLSNVLECGDAEIVREAQTLLKSFLGE